MYDLQQVLNIIGSFHLARLTLQQVEEAFKLVWQLDPLVIGEVAVKNFEDKLVAGTMTRTSALASGRASTQPKMTRMRRRLGQRTPVSMNRVGRLKTEEESAFDVEAGYKTHGHLKIPAKTRTLGNGSKKMSRGFDDGLCHEESAHSLD